MNPESEEFQVEDDESSVDYIPEGENSVADNEYMHVPLRRSLDEVNRHPKEVFNGQLLAQVMDLRTSLNAGVLTDSDRLTVIIAYENLLEERKKNPARKHRSAVKQVASILGYSLTTVHSIVRAAERGELELGKQVPANRGPRERRFLWSERMEHKIVSFVSERRSRGVVTTGTDVATHLLESGDIKSDGTENGKKSAIRAMQRYLHAYGWTRGVVKGNLSEVQRKSLLLQRIFYFESLKWYRAHRFRFVFLDESFIHENYTNLRLCLYHPMKPETMGPRPKEGGRRIAFIAAIISATTRSRGNPNDLGDAQLIQECNGFEQTTRKERGEKEDYGRKSPVFYLFRDQASQRRGSSRRAARKATN